MTARKLGAHLSISGGVYRSLQNAQKLHINALQLFLKNSNQWAAKPYSETDIKTFNEEREKCGDIDLFAHSGYLINLAGDNTIREQSIRAVIDELKRAEQLRIPYLILHPGSHKNAGIDVGISRIIEAIDSIYSSVNSEVMLLFETTAGQGASIGHKFEYLAQIIASSAFSDKLGVCIDTCHIFASGYDITSQTGYSGMKREIEHTVSFKKIRCIHLNDSKKACGSRIDRHEHIGKGYIGIRGFDHLLSDKDFRHIPLILETPKKIDSKNKIHDDLYADRINIKRVYRILHKLYHK